MKYIWYVGLFTFSACFETKEEETRKEGERQGDCSDDEDNDDDGKVDCEDAGCSNKPACEPNLTESGSEGVQAIFDQHCVACHGGALYPSLDGDLCEDIVGVSSEQVSNMPLITPGSIDESYLYHKLTGTYLDIGGYGSQMPVGSTLTEDEVDVVAVWIYSGAVCE